MFSCITIVVQLIHCGTLCMETRIILIHNTDVGPKASRLDLSVSAVQKLPEDCCEDKSANFRSINLLETSGD